MREVQYFTNAKNVCTHTLKTTDLISFCYLHLIDKNTKCNIFVSTGFQLKNLLNFVYRFTILSIVPRVFDQVSQVYFTIHQFYLQFLKPLLTHQLYAFVLFGFYHFSHCWTTQWFKSLLDHVFLLHCCNSKLVLEIWSNIFILLLYLYLLSWCWLLICLKIIIIVLLQLLIYLFLNLFFFRLYCLLDSSLLLRSRNRNIRWFSRKRCMFNFLKLMINIFHFNIIDCIENGL